MPNFTVRVVDWNGPEGDDARAIRMAVFVNEQKCPEETEIDEIDPQALHVVAYAQDEKPAGTGRLFVRAEEPESAVIGRLAVLEPYRRKGCGSAIMNALLEEATERNYKQAQLSAQLDAISFYEQHGFQAEGDVYMDANIPHRKMRKSLNPS